MTSNLSEFLASLLQANIDKVLQTDTPANVSPVSTSVSIWKTKGELNTFLSSLQPEIMKIARNLYYHVQSRLSVEIDDLIQEGIIAAWECTQRYDPSKVVNERSFFGGCIKMARFRMITFLQKEEKLPVTSLEEFLEGETESGTYTQELADTPVRYHQVSLSKRRLVLSLLKNLSKQERLVIMSTFRIDGSKGNSPTLDSVQARLQLSNSTIRAIKSRALKKLAANKC